MSEGNISQIFARLEKYISAQEKLVCQLQSELTAAKALPPEHGGEGEIKKALVLERFLKGLGWDDIKRIDADDPRVPSTVRPNLVFSIPGRSSRTLWIFTHMDVVAAGDLEAWSGDPWQVMRRGDLLYGRGVEDNQQAMVSSLILASAIKECDITPTHSLGLVFMADEECGSNYGLAHILKMAPELFHQDDLYLVPDFGNSLADQIEVAEKAVLWLKITILGQQCHASTPAAGRNALVAAADVITHLHQTLPELFAAKDPLFSPPVSTFVPSRHESELLGINILPGRDVFHLDCRLLPEVEPQEVLERVGSLVRERAGIHGCEGTVSQVQLVSASRAPQAEADISDLSSSIAAVYGTRPVPIGVGGGTVAALLREKGLPALVFSCIMNSCHAPDEHSSISATLKDSCVFAHLLLNARGA